MGRVALRPVTAPSSRLCYRKTYLLHDREQPLTIDGRGSGQPSTVNNVTAVEEEHVLALLSTRVVQIVRGRKVKNHQLRADRDSAKSHTQW